MRAATEPGVHTMSDELILQISCNMFLAFEWVLMMTSGQNISHYTTAKLSVHVWNHDLIGWQNKIGTQKHFHKTTITNSWTLSKTKIPITIIKAQMPSNPNQKSRTRDNDVMTWNRSPHYRRFVKVIHWEPADFSHSLTEIQWCGALIFYLLAWNSFDQTMALPVVWPEMTLMWIHCNVLTQLL